jgi:hypothetical protein
MKALDDFVAIDHVYRQKYKWINLAKELLKEARFYTDVIDVIGKDYIEIERKCYPLEQFNADRQYTLRLINENISQCSKKITAFYFT